MKSIVMFIAAALVSQPLLAETVPTAGSARLRSSGMRFDFGYEVQRSQNQVRGYTFNQGHNFVNLVQNERGWNGRFGDTVISRALVTKQSANRTEIEIATMPQGFFSFTVKRNRRGDLEISGMGPRGQLNRGSLSADGYQLSAGTGFGASLNLRKERRKSNQYTGSIILNTRGGGLNNGFATLTVAGSLDPRVVAQDPVLYTILYVLPFSR